MRVLVTGGAGFIGSHLVDALLNQGDQVAVIDNLSSGVRENLPAGAEFFELDIRNAAGVQQAFEQFRPEAVSHQAAQLSVSRSVREPGYDAEVNVVGMVNVCAAATQTGVPHLVFASSGGVLYGDVSVPATEDFPSNPVSPYGISKWAGEQYLQFFQRESGMSATALRYANVYGERQNPHGEAGVVAIFCQLLLSGQTPTINGDGKYVRDYVHVSDVVRANLLALASPGGSFETVNVGTGLGTDVNELGELIAHHFQQELESRGGTAASLPFQHGPARPGDLRSNLLSNEKARRLLGWSPQMSLEQGIRQTVRWFAARQS